MIRVANRAGTTIQREPNVDAPRLSAGIANTFDRTTGMQSLSTLTGASSSTMPRGDNLLG
jgi:hypothetical protein